VKRDRGYDRDVAEVLGRRRPAPALVSLDDARLRLRDFASWLTTQDADALAQSAVNITGTLETCQRLADWFEKYTQALKARQE